MNELESEQAQTIAEIKRRHADAYIKPTGKPCEYDGHIAFEQVTELLEIVDSQAQKNEKLLVENNVLAILVDELKADREAQAVKISEQAKEIDKLKDRLRFEMQPEAKEGI